MSDPHSIKGIGSFNLEVASMKQKLENKDRDLTDVTGKYQRALNECQIMEDQLKVMKEKVKEADNKLTEVKAESEAAIRQKENDHQELKIMRRRSLVGGGGQIITQMYETILLRYEELKTTHDELQRKMTDEVEKRSKVEVEQQLNTFRLQDHCAEMESLTQQNQSLREHVETLKRDLNRQTKDLNRIREERTSFKREYYLVMSERDAVHKEMDKLQEDLTSKQQENDKMETQNNHLAEEIEKLKSQLDNLKQGSVASLDYNALQEELYAALQERKQALEEKDAKVHEAYIAQKAHKQALERIEKLSVERDVLKVDVDLSKQQLKEAIEEAKATTKWRELAFSERDKVNCELEESRRLCGKLTEERENLIKQLEEAVKELDIMKEAKKKIQVKLHEMQTRSDLRSLENENAHSHDSAIDSGDWESDPNDSCYKLARVIRVLPRQHDITIETGYFIKHSSTPGVAVGDRIISLGDVPVQNKSERELNELLSRKSVLLHLLKYLPIRKTSASLASSHDEMKTIPNGFSTSPQQQSPNENNVWTGDNAQVVLRARKPNQPYIKTLHHSLNPALVEIVCKKIDSRDSTIFHCEEDESQVSDPSIFSEPPYGMMKTEDNKPNTENLSNSYSTSKKKKPTSRFWLRKKKGKSVSASTIGEHSGGTWPRLDSPSLNNVLTGGGGGVAGRLSVFSRKKNRPPISSSTFTPPENPSAGHTPPTALRQYLAVSPVSPSSSFASQPHSPPLDGVEITPLSSKEPATSITSRSRHQRHVQVKKKRPLSAPIVTPGLSMWQHPVLIESSQANTTIPSAQESAVQSPPALSNRTPPTGHAPSPVHSYDPTSSPHPSASPLINRSTYIGYQRQQSVPESNKLSLALPASCFVSSLNTSSVSTSSRSRNANSLPRPTSASRGPMFSVSHSSHESRKAKTLECKRIRIPSEVSVGLKLSGSEKGSITLSSDRSTSLVFSSVDPLSLQGNSARSTPHPDSSVSSLSVASSTPSTRSRKPPVSNDPRYVTMVKGSEPIGISIVSGEHGGIFVSRLNDHSLASMAGMEYGDQLLEYNGVNLRNAKEEQARVIMSQTQPGDNIKFLAQYNLEKYKQSIESNLSDTLGISRPPPQNGTVLCEEVEEGTITPEVTPRASPQVEETLRTQRLTDPRYVFMSGGCTNVKLVGGNEVGIYVASLTSNDETLTDKPSELKIGDRIIEFNSVSFASVTLESASLMMSQCNGGASFCVMYEPTRLRQIYGLPGDHFYVRALFDHMVEQEGALQFTRNSILLVENTYPDYVTGQWSASLVDEQGGRSTRGRIPSKITWEKERENLSHLSDDVTSTTGSSSGKRLSGSGRKSFFKRLKPHRTSSRSSGDIRLHRSPSENSLESTVEGANDPLGVYQVVEKHSSANMRRPVVVFGPHSAPVVEKLAREYTHQFVKCCLNSSIEMPHNSEIIETYNYVTGIRILTGDILKQTMKQFPNRHVLFEASVEAIDRLHSLKVYPIIAFVKYSSAKKIKESQDRVAGREKITIKQCKEMLEKQYAIEQTLLSKYYGTVSINGGTANAVATKISKVVSHEHNKVLWLPSNSNLLNYC